jgi:hypothetical protein
MYFLLRPGDLLADEDIMNLVEASDVDEDFMNAEPTRMHVADPTTINLDGHDELHGYLVLDVL